MSILIWSDRTRMVGPYEYTHTVRTVRVRSKYSYGLEHIQNKKRILYVELRNTLLTKIKPSSISREVYKHVDIFYKKNIYYLCINFPLTCMRNRSKNPLTKLWERTLIEFCWLIIPKWLIVLQCLKFAAYYKLLNII